MKSKITLYAAADYKGRSTDFTESCPDLLDAGFDYITSSAKCEKGVWILYAEKNYRGNIFVVQDGEDYNEKLCDNFNDKASSLRLLDNFNFTEEPECTLYEDDNYKGRSLTFHEDVPNLKWYKFNDEMSSIVVQSGAWVGYKGVDYEGEQSLFLKGSYVMSDLPNDKGGFSNESLSSMKKIKKFVGQMKLLTIHYDLDKKHVIRTPSSVFTWTQKNNTGVEQVLKKTDEVTITREDTYEFRWDVGTKVSTTMTASVGIPLVGKTEVSISAEFSASMGSTAGTNTSKTEKWIAEYPSKIPPYSTVTVTSKLTEGKLNVPYTAILYYGDDTKHTVAKHGVFYGCQFFDFHTEFNETKLPKPK